MKNVISNEERIKRLKLNCSLHADGKIKYFHQGKEYVDLGLPSGTLWATMNVGATSETDYGLYFQWGDTQGYADVSIKTFRWSNYKYGDESKNFTKYNATDGKTVLDLEDDAARANWGGNWHMPTDTQFKELLNTSNCTNTWVTDYQGSGINGRLFTSKKNGNTLFIPAASTAGYGIIGNVGEYGTVWSSSLYSFGVKYGHYLYLDRDYISLGSNYRFYGRSVRGVIG